LGEAEAQKQEGIFSLAHKGDVMVEEKQHEKTHEKKTVKKAASKDVKMAIERLPRVKLVHLPTPLVEAEELSRELGGPRILIKRDDLTGFAMGGTKGRMLEFSMGVAKQESFDVVILYAAAQSNYSRQLAAAASKLGMRTILLLEPREVHEVQGNLLLDRILGAEIEMVERIDNKFSAEGIREFDEIHAKIVERLRHEGHKPLVVDKWYHPSVWSVVGAIACALELCGQLSDANLSPDYLFTTLGSGATYTGLLLGMKACALPTKVVGVTIVEKRDGLHSAIVSRAHEATRLLGVDIDLSLDEVVFYDEYAGPAYGILTAEAKEAIKLVARTEGIFLDPVYTGKAMSGLIDQIRRGRIGQDKTVVFLHSGGTPALFAYHRELTDS